MALLIVCCKFLLPSPVGVFNSHAMPLIIKSGVLQLFLGINSTSTPKKSHKIYAADISDAVGFGKTSFGIIIWFLLLFFAMQKLITRQQYFSTPNAKKHI